MESALSLLQRLADAAQLCAGSSSFGGGEQSNIVARELYMQELATACKMTYEKDLLAFRSLKEEHAGTIVYEKRDT